MIKPALFTLLMIDMSNPTLEPIVIEDELSGSHCRELKLERIQELEISQGVICVVSNK